MSATAGEPTPQSPVHWLPSTSTTPSVSWVRTSLPEPGSIGVSPTRLLAPPSVRWVRRGLPQPGSIPVGPTRLPPPPTVPRVRTSLPRPGSIGVPRTPLPPPPPVERVLMALPPAGTINVPRAPRPGSPRVQWVRTTLPRPGTIALPRRDIGRGIPVERVALSLPQEQSIPVPRVLRRRSVRVERVRRRPPVPGSLPVQAPGPGEEPVLVGQSDLGAIVVRDQVVAKIASRAAVEVDDAGAVAPKVLGIDLGGMVGRRTALDELPKVDASVDGGRCFLGLTLSVRYPAPVPTVTDTVRRHVTERVRTLVGLEVSDVKIHVTALVSELPDRARVA